ncbi:hypothetical protein ACFL7E_06655 [Thermodesulfobacteriota bacterium]
MVKLIGEEQYKCSSCSKEPTIHEIITNWRCPDCDKPIDILIELSGSKYMARRVRAQELNKGDCLVIGNFIHEILDLIYEKNQIHIGLKGYGVLKHNPLDFIIIFKGGGWIKE